MTKQEDTIIKLESFLTALTDLINDTLAAGVHEQALRRTLMAQAVVLFKSPAAAADGIVTMDRFREALVRELMPSPQPVIR